MLFSLLSLLISASAPLTVQATPAAQDSALITMQAEAAFQGHFKFGEWLPVWVEVENQGVDRDAEIQVRVPGSGGTMVFTVPVPLPAGARKRIPVYVLPNNYTRQLKVDLLSGNELLASTKVLVVAHPNITYLVGLITPERGPLALISAAQLPGMAREKVLVDARLEQLPERFEALRSFDCLVLNNVDTSTLTPRQVSALQLWVGQGGRLVIGGGSQVAMTTAGLPDTLLPFRPQTPEPYQLLNSVASLAGFTASNTPILMPGPFLVAVGQYTGGKALASEITSSGEVPLLTEWSLGSGFVDFVALDLQSAPFDGWSGTIDFWSALLSPGAAYPSWLAPDVSLRQQIAASMPYPLSNLPVLDLPSVKGLALLLGIYILVVGPGNYFLLKRRQKLHWAWVTIPVITVIFSIGSFVLGYALHGSDIFINKIAVIETQPSGLANVTTYVGLFSPNRQTYEVEISGNGLVSPLAPYYDPWNSFSDPNTISSRQEVRLQQSEPAYVRGLSVDQWAMQSFMIEGQAIELGSIQADLQLVEQQLTGVIRNQTGADLEDVVLMFGGNFTHLGTLPSGAQVEVNFPIGQVSQMFIGPPLSYRVFEEQLNSPQGPRRETEVRRSIIENVFERAPVFSNNLAAAGAALGTAPSATILIWGWSRQAPPEIRVGGSTPAEQATTLVYTRVPYSLPQSGAISLPPGVIPGVVTELPRDGGICGMPGATAVYTYRGEAIFEFYSPARIGEWQIDSLLVNLDTDSGMFFTPGVALYDWQSGQWVKLAEVLQGTNWVSDPARFISPEGVIRVQLSAPEELAATGGCYYVSLGLEGTR